MARHDAPCALRQGTPTGQRLGQGAKRAQEEGKYIFLQTIFQFKSKHPAGSFERFLEEVWPADFEVFERTRAAEPGFTRNYDSWRAIFRETSMEGFVCPHCRERYCIKHRVAVEHGCAAASKQAARAACGGGKKKPLKGNERKAIEAKLKKKQEQVKRDEAKPSKAKKAKKKK